MLSICHLRCFALKCAQMIENARVMVFGKHKCVQAYQKKGVRRCDKMVLDVARISI